MTFGPYNFRYPQLKEQSDKADLVGTFTDDDGVLQTKSNKWNQIYDFTTKAGGDNFSVVPPEAFQVIDAANLIPQELVLEPTAHMDYLFELPVEYGGTLVQQAKAKDSLMAFDIRTGAQAAEDAFRQMEAKKE